MKIIITVFIVFILFSSKGCNQVGTKCGDIYCNENNGECIEQNLKSECVCYEEFETFPKNNLTKCNYVRKIKIKAFLLELFLSFGAGHFYSQNYKLAIPKFLFWILSYYGFIVLKALQKGNENNKRFTKLIKLSAIIVMVIMLIWQILDIILFGINYYKDGNAIEMI